MDIDYSLLGSGMVQLYAADSSDDSFDVYADSVRQLGFGGVAAMVHYNPERPTQRDTVRKVLYGCSAPTNWREHKPTSWASTAQTLQASQVFQGLSDKEIAILYYKASGKAMKQISDELDITAAYAANVLTRLRRRLNCINNDRLMYLFGQLNSSSSAPTR